MDASNRRWKKGKKSSLLFYENKIRYKELQFNKIFPLHPYFGEMLKDLDCATIADVGAGMFSTTGSTWENKKIILYPSDILADEYNEILTRHNVKPIIPVKKEDMTNLSYDNNFFDIVNSINALDHCSNPMKALQEMYRVCKVGGWIYTRNFYNNAEYEHYNGFHEWNMADENDDCVIWNNENKFYVSDYFERFEVSRQSYIDNRDISIILKIRK